MDCPKCGVHNPDDAERCRICGNLLRPAAKPSGPTRKCPFCQAENSPDAIYCSGCNKMLRTMTDKTPEVQEMKKEKYRDRYDEDYPLVAQRTWRASVGGIVIMMTGLLALVDALLTVFPLLNISDADYDRLQEDIPQLETVIANIMVCQAIRFVFVAIAIMGGYFAIMRLRWGFAMLGGVFSIIAVLSSLLILIQPYWGAVVGLVLIGDIIGVAMVGLAKKEFTLA